jgi:hypothetical protein
MKLPDFKLPNIKLDKDQQKKVLLSTMLLIGTIYCYFTFLLNPLRASEVAAEAESAGYEKKITEADQKMRGFNSLKAQAAEAGELVAQVNAFIPNGAPIAWFPPRMRAFFDRQGLKGSLVRLRSTEKPEPDLAKGFISGNWIIELPQTSFFPLGIALAGLENEEFLLEITDLKIATRAESPEFQNVTVEAATLLKDVSLQR